MIYYIFIGTLLHYTYTTIKYIVIAVEKEVKGFEKLITSVTTAIDQIDDAFDNLCYIFNYTNDKVKRISNNCKYVTKNISNKIN